ncbi:DNA-3-methyladenine glycosylase 2 family protein [Thalassotalea fusca]
MNLSTEICEQARLSRDARFDGKFYTAVLSTGIFCRPVCPARQPKSENVRYYATAEQAQQAGYRPCKRCIPTQAPMIAAPNRIRQIAHNTNFTTTKISDIANQYGISERQLLRDFKKHYGLTPSQYFQQQRLLLAHRLLCQTLLPITDVCYAAGFQSLRRFNESIKAQYHTTPSELRGKPKTESSSDSVTLLLSYRPPLDWPLMLSFFRSRQISQMEHIDETCYQRSIAINDCVGWLRVSHHPNKEALVLETKLSDYSYLNKVIMRVRKMFDLDADMQLIHQTLSTNKQLAKQIALTPGLRLPGSWDIFEFSIRAILGQQVSVKAATTFAARIAEKYGVRNEQLPDHLSRIFPTQAQLLHAEFDGIGLTQSRISTLKNWLEYLQKNSNSLASYQDLPSLEKALNQIKGIGPWTVNYLAMRGLSEPDAFPSADLGIIKALTVDGQKPKQKDILELAEQWRPWRAYATIYLWQSLAHA